MWSATRCMFFCTSFAAAGAAALPSAKKPVAPGASALMGVEPRHEANLSGVKKAAEVVPKAQKKPVAPGASALKPGVWRRELQSKSALMKRKQRDAANLSGVKKASKVVPKAQKKPVAPGTSAYMRREKRDAANLSGVKKASEVVPKAHIHGSVMYIVKTHSANHDRLNAVMKTWGSFLDTKNLIISSDARSDEWESIHGNWASAVHLSPECGLDKGQNQQSLTCRVADSLAHVSKLPRWSWVMVVDDDHYLRTAKLEEFLAGLDPSKKIGVGNWGCGLDKKVGISCNGAGGFCGGCAFGFSRAALDAMIEGNASAFVEFHRANMRKDSPLHLQSTFGRDDIALSCTAHMKVKDLEIHHSVELPHGETRQWEVIPAEIYDHEWWHAKCKGKNPPMSREAVAKIQYDASSYKGLGWHHVNPELMLALHDTLANHRNKTRPLSFIQSSLREATLEDLFSRFEHAMPLTEEMVAMHQAFKHDTSVQGSLILDNAGRQKRLLA